MPARDEEERERPAPGRWAGDTAATHSAGWGSPHGTAQAVGEAQGTVYGSGRWGSRADSPSGYGGPSATGYGQGAPGHSGYGQGDPGQGTGVSHAGATGYAGYTGSTGPSGATGYGGYAGTRGPQTQAPSPRAYGPTEQARTRPDWFDQDYQQWRDEQIRKLDNDYLRWREARYRKFADEFDAWRSGRQDTAATLEPGAAPGPAPDESAPGRALSPPAESIRSGSGAPAGTPGTPPSPISHPRNQELP
ncbi:MAG: hypothetical protein RL513_116 [Pseudomonadota bacterium]